VDALKKIKGMSRPEKRLSGRTINFLLLKEQEIELRSNCKGRYGGTRKMIYSDFIVAGKIYL
jgi:hypothetical protein